MQPQEISEFEFNDSCTVCFGGYRYCLKPVKHKCSSGCSFWTCENCTKDINRCLWCRKLNTITERIMSTDKLNFDLEKINERMKFVSILRQMSDQYHSEFKDKIEELTSGLDTAISAYQHIRTTRDVSFKIQIVSSCANVVVAVILLVSPLAPAGVIIGSIKLAVDVVNTTGTCGVMYCFQKKLETALARHDEILQSMRFTQFIKDYEITEFYLNAEDLHRIKIHELKVSTRINPDLPTGALRIGQGAALIGVYNLPKKLPAELCEAALRPACSTLLDLFDGIEKKQLNVFTVANGILAILDLVNLYYTKEQKDHDFKIYDKHIEELTKTKDCFQKVTSWCKANLNDTQINKLEKEIQIKLANNDAIQKQFSEKKIEGIKEAKLEVARNMIQEGMNASMISKIAGLPLEIITDLIESNSKEQKQEESTTETL